MSFSENFEAAKNLAMEAAQTAAAKAKELAAVAKANISIYAEEDKVKKAEIELGKLYYRDYAVGEELDSAEYLPWCQKIDESKKAIAELKDKGVWVFGTAAEGSIPMYKADLTIPAAIVIGNEGEGLSQLVRKNCDVMVSIPMKGKISSLNASAAASILLYEAVRQRIG